MRYFASPLKINLNLYQKHISCSYTQPKISVMQKTKALLIDAFYAYYLLF